MKLLDILIASKQNLKEAGVTSPFLDAEILLAAVLEKTREFVIGYPEYQLSVEEIAKFNAFIKRRASFEPVAKIIGAKEFWGREFFVSGATLDPRPDSESLIEEVFRLLPDKNTELKILDLGTGTGCLLLTLLAEYPNAQGTGVDISEDALNIAKNNAIKLGLANKSEFILNDWAARLGGKFDIIISNPPYIKNSDIEDLAPEVSTYEPRLALAGGDDGLDCYRKLAFQTKDILNENGYIIFEFGKGQENDLRKILEQAGMRFVSLKNDLTGTPRCIVVN
jgi:release factor glutamine methyltransferase